MALNETAGILLKIKADGSDAQAKIKAFQNDLKGIEKSARDQLGPLEQLGARAGLSAQQFDNLKVGALAAVAGIGAIAGVAASVSFALFNLAKSSAEYGSEIFDATEKTGLAAETISSIKVAADQSGTSLDAVTTGLSRFAKTIGEAGTGSDKAQQQLKVLGVTSNDLETALAQALTTIAKYPAGVQQMTAAQAAFGRSGAELLPFIKSFDGDLPALIAKCKELGLTLSNADAKAADEFGDTLDTLTAQAAATGRVFVGPLMRDITRSMTGISGSLAQNQQAVKDWGESVAATMRGLKTVAQELYDFSQTVPGRALAYLLFGQIIEANAALQKLGGPPAPATPISTPPTPRLIPGNDILPPPNPGLSEEEKKAAEDRRKAREAAFQKEVTAQSRQNALMLSGTRSEFAANQAFWEDAFAAGKETQERFREESLKNLAVYEKNVKDRLANALQLDSIGKTGTELKNVNLQYQQAIAALNREIAQERADIEKTITATVKKEIEERTKAEEQSAENKIAIAQSRAQTRIAELQNDLRVKAINEIQFETLATREKVSVMESELRATKDLTKQELLRQEIRREELSLQGRLLDIEIRRREEEERFIEKGLKDLDVIIEGLRKNVGKKKADASNQERYEDERDTGLTDGIFRGMGVGTPSIWTEYEDEFGNVVSRVKTEAEHLKDIYADISDFAGGAIGSMIDGLAQMATQWLITGDFSAKAALSMLASIAMSVATEAGFKALMEVANGIAAQAITWGVPNPKSIAHFAAAKAYAVTAAVAGGAGVALALGARAAGGGESSGRDRDREAMGQGDRKEPKTYSRESEFAYISGTLPVFENLNKNVENLAATMANPPMPKLEVTMPDNVLKGPWGVVDRWQEQATRLSATVDRLAGVTEQQAAATSDFANKVDSTRPGDVFMRGMAQNPGAVGKQVVSDVSRNSSIGRELRARSGSR